MFVPAKSSSTAGHPVQRENPSDLPQHAQKKTNQSHVHKMGFCALLTACYVLCPMQHRRVLGVWFQLYAELLMAEQRTAPSCSPLTVGGSSAINFSESRIGPQVHVSVFSSVLNMYQCSTLWSLYCACIGDRFPQHIWASQCHRLPGMVKKERGR